jgi:D-alanyl-lipoteichoic acid biosynthesis protein DltD
MKKNLKAFIICIPVCFITLFIFQFLFMHIIEGEYKDDFARDLTENKFKSISVQKMAIQQKDNLFIYGSSELEAGLNFSTNPYNFFSHYQGIQANLMGMAGFQSLVHSVNFGALGSQLKGQKAVFIISPQWFTPASINVNTFEANSSVSQMYAFLFNPQISDETKQEFSVRFLSITSQSSNEAYDFVRNFCILYSKSDAFSNFKRFVYTPFYWSQYQIVLLKDELKTYKYFKKIHVPDVAGKGEHPLSGLQTINWNSELQNAAAQAQQSSSNPYGMENKAYNYFIKVAASQDYKDSLKIDPNNAPEFEDFKILLTICRESGIKPLFISVPLNGKWYNDEGIGADVREAYYSRIASMVESCGFDFADLSGHEYDNYFFQDPSHLGWTGWVYVDQAIVNYYNKN